MQTLTTGSFLQHKSYRIDRVLGQGGFGITYLATDINLQRKVAIKEFFPKDFCQREDTTSHVTLGTQNTADFVNRLKAKFLKEARNIAKFDHPNIIRIFAAFEENNTAYYVMEYIEGESISEKVKRDGPVAPALAIEYIGKVGSALDYVHARKINHLDVKPANIMIRRSDNTPILIDFGLSKQYDTEGHETSTTPTGISHGYAPMEQYNAGGVKEFSPQTDVYSLAATLYYILSGVVPPQATRLVDEELTFPATIPVNMIGPISKAMNTGRRNRQETVDRFIADVKSADAKTESAGTAPKTDTPKAEPPKADTTIQDNPGTSNINIGAYTTPDPVQSEPEKADSDPQTGGGRKKKYMIAGGVAVALVCIIFFIVNSNSGGSAYTEDLYETVDTIPVDAIVEVVDIDWDSPLGKAKYSGETLGGSEPHGVGIAKIKSGDLAGAIYAGRFENGKMEGETTYTMSNGDVFTGKFHNNQFEEGKYLIKETGEYFVGKFRDKKPYKGTWFTAEGKVSEKI